MQTGEKDMTLINPINVNAQGIGSATGFGAKPKTEEEAPEKEAAAATAEEKPQLSADTILNYMAQSAVTVQAANKKTVDPSKYVDSESAARIAGFMADFEGKVATGLKAFDQEFGDSNVSDSSKMAVVLKQINKEA